jgi:hypothetical protein
MNTDDKGTTNDAIAATSDGPIRSPRRPGQTLFVAGADRRSCSRRGVEPRSGARPRAVTGPGNSPARPRQGAPPSRSSTG